MKQSAFSRQLSAFCLAVMRGVCTRNPQSVISELSDDYAAGNAGPGVAGGVGLPVVGFRVDNKGSAPLMK